MTQTAETEQKTAVIYCRQSFKHDKDSKSIADQLAQASVLVPFCKGGQYVSRPKISKIFQDIK